MDEPAKVSKESVYDASCFLSRWFFTWVIPLFNIGNKRTIDFADLDVCSKDDDPKYNTEKLEREWNRELALFKLKKIKEPNLVRALTRAFGPTWFWYIQSTIWPEMIARIAQPFMIQKIVQYLSSDDPASEQYLSFQEAEYYAIALIVISAVFAVTRHYAFLLSQTLGMNMRSALTVLLFKKILRVSKTSFKQTDVGQVLNVVANDLFRIEELSTSMYGFIVGPVMATAVIVIVWYNIGVSCIGGVIILCLFIPFQSFMGRLFHKYRHKTSRVTDRRVRLMNEILSAMKLIKVYCWEKPFSSIVNGIRKEEVDTIRKTYVLRGINAAVSFICTRLMLFASLLIFSLLGNELTPSKVFVTMALYNALKQPVMNTFTNAIGNGAESLVATRRVLNILMLDEKPAKRDVNDLPDGSIVFSKYHGKWTQTLQVDNLININLKVNPGELVIVVGSVGSGKTCFLWALLNEIMHVSGECSLAGKTSYAPQESWCFGGSIKQNILVGHEYDHDRYKDVMKSCCLDKDIRMFKEGDDTFVGEKGYTLSGGQKARVTLARAVYNHADVYLLDDPLSAVDPKVGSRMFDRCIKGFLKGKTVILVTHQLQFLKKADKIVVLKEGRAVAVGTYGELIHNNTDFISFLNQTEEESRKRTESESRERALTLKARNSSAAERSEKEEKELQEQAESRPQVDRSELQTKGAVKSRVYLDYLKSGGSYWLMYAALTISLGCQGLYHATDLWMSAWTQKNIAIGNGSVIISEAVIFNEEHYNVIVYCILMGLLFAGSFIRTSATFSLCLRCSIYLHDAIFKRVLRAPMLFFENTPLGRIMNRFTKDVGVVDQNIPQILVELNMNLVQALGIIIMTIVINYWLAIPCVILFSLSIPLRNYYIKTARDLQRLDSIVRSPVYAHITATFDGLITVRAFGLEQKFEDQYYKFMRDSVSCRFLCFVAGRLIGIILDIIVAIYITIIICLCVYSPKGVIAGGDAGVILSASILLTGMFQYAIRMTAEFETYMISAERVFEYGRLESEAALKIHGNDMDAKWPKRGEVVFDHVYLRYSKELPHVLKNITFTVNAGETVGVVGRTGAGKSSLISVLFRLVEPEGKILIDGIDIRSLGLHELREKISIIPQDPSLFSGTIRKNLDPFDKYEDDHLWSALNEANLGPAIKNMDKQLYALVSEGGGNLSIGQRQLLCLARSLLRDNRILVMDEATANVDQETDSQIQSTIRTKFEGYTIITIAHRLHTIIDMDKILVMDEGQVLEYDAPFLLLSNSEGAFYSMVKETGPDFEKMLHEMAEKSYRDKAKRRSVKKSPPKSEK